MAVVVALAAVAVIIPSLAGAVPLTVLTSSMEPGLPPGTLIVVRQTAPEEITIGDVVTYQIQSGKADVVTHRVLEIVSSTDGTRTFITQGDNNPQPDPNPVVDGQIKGTVWYSIPFIGHAAVGLGGAGKSWVVTGVAVVLLGYAALLLGGGIRDARRKRVQVTLR